MEETPTATRATNSEALHCSEQEPDKQAEQAQWNLPHKTARLGISQEEGEEQLLLNVNCHGPTYVTILYLKRDRQGFSNCLRFTGLKQQQVFKDIAFQSFSLFLSPRRINRISKAFLCVHQVQHFLHVSLTLQLWLRKANKQWLQHQHSHLAEMLCQTPHTRWDRLGDYEEISHFFPAEQVSQQTARSVTD